MSTYQTFNKYRLFILLPDGTQVDAPQYIIKAMKRFRYCDADGILYKQCYTCRKWFKVSQFKDNQWIDIHLESEYHLVESGFGSYCRSCSLSRAKPPKQKSDKPINPKAVSDTPLKKCSVFLSEEHRIELKVRAAKSSKTISAVLAEIIEQSKDGDAT